MASSASRSVAGDAAAPGAAAPPPADVLVRAVGLRKAFGDAVVVDGVDLEVPAGTVHAVLGPNGAGKTTTVRLLTTLLGLDGGTASVAGHDVATEGDAVRRAIGLAGQDAAVDEHLTGFENLELLGRLHGLPSREAAARADELLGRFRLADVRDRAAGSYSGGMRRRLDLAGALVAHPRVVVLDEPTTGLDPRSRLDVWAVIRELLSDGVAVLLTTQYLEEADQLADQVTVIDRGTMIARGAPEELKALVSGARIAVEVAEEDGAERAVAALEAAGAEDVALDDRGRRAAGRVEDGPSTLLEVLRRMDAEDVRVADFGVERSTLDDVFLELTGPEARELEPVPRAPEAARDADASRAPAPGRSALGAVRATLREGAFLAQRNLRHVARIPGRIVTGLVQPIMFVLLFAYVFGGSLGGAAYREFLLAGIFAQTMVFNSSFTTVGLANDLQRGIVERLGSLPVSPLSLVLGRTVADLLVSAGTLVVLSLCGLLIGWRIEGGVADAVLAYALALLFAFAMSWVGATIGLVARSVEVAQSAGLIWLFPVTLISTAFVSAEQMPEPLRTFATYNPVSAVATALRDLLGNSVPRQLPQPGGWPADHAGTYAVLCCVAILAVFLPLALTRYRRFVRR